MFCCRSHHCSRVSVRMWRNNIKLLNDKIVRFNSPQKNKLDGNCIPKILSFITSCCSKQHFLKTVHCILDDCTQSVNQTIHQYPAYYSCVAPLFLYMYVFTALLSIVTPVFLVRDVTLHAVTLLLAVFD